MVDVLVILDGASEPLGDAPTSLERAHTPILDGLAAEGSVTPLRTVPAGLPAGSETAIPTLLGWTPDGPVDRGAIEAAAYGIEIGLNERAWRVDRRDRADASAIAGALSRLLTEHRVRHLGGHRMLVVGPEPLPTLAADPLPALTADLRVWPTGAVPPRVLDEGTVLIGAPGAAVGIAQLMGARTIVPAGATGRPGSDLAAKAAAAVGAIESTMDGAIAARGQACSRVVVHVGAPDEAAHARDANAKVAAIEAADALLLAPLADALRAQHATFGAGALRVCPDHGCDPATGEHDGEPVPCLDWPAAQPSGGRLTERAIAAMAVWA